MILSGDHKLAVNLEESVLHVYKPESMQWVYSELMKIWYTSSEAIKFEPPMVAVQPFQFEMLKPWRMTPETVANLRCARWTWRDSDVVHWSNDGPTHERASAPIHEYFRSCAALYGLLADWEESRVTLGSDK